MRVWVLLIRGHFRLEVSGIGAYDRDQKFEYSPKPLVKFTENFYADQFIPPSSLAKRKDR